ncbi:unnamed protein product [Ilex paraguariensis]|uniref:tryptophan synthase n=1 Tax=Ilex paraguariensis TaxID=185542 RepID=A0ABC8RFN4_9AQUA
MKAIVEASEGFVYLVSSVGVTGARASVSAKVQTLLQEIKEATSKPVAVGFGISKPEHVKQVAGWGADGVIVGSAMVSSVGVTGARASVSAKVQTLLQEIKEATSKPVAVGFGISKPEHVKQVAGWGADGVIVGSAMVKLLGEAKSPQEGLKELESFTKSLKAALD